MKIFYVRYECIQQTRKVQNTEYKSPDLKLFIVCLQSRYVDHQAAGTQLNSPPVLYLFRRKLSILSVFRFIIMAWQQAQCADAVPVLCLSVCLSVQCRYCLNKCTNLHTFWGPARAIILVFFSLAALTQFKVQPLPLLAGGIRYTMVGKVCNIRPKSPFISEMVRHRLRLLWITNRKW